MANGKYTKFNPDVKSLQEAVRFLFARDGSKRSSFANVRLYGYKKSALLDWVTGASNSFTRNTLMVSTDKGNAHAPWVGRAMVNNILNLIKNIKPVWVRLDTGEITKSIWGSHPCRFGHKSKYYAAPSREYKLGAYGHHRGRTASLTRDNCRNQTGWDNRKLIAYVCSNVRRYGRPYQFCA